MIVIQDGTGSGNKLAVNKLNRALIEAETLSKDQDINERTGKVWSVSFENISPTGTDDFIFYLENTGNNDIEVSDFRISTETAATQIAIVGASGTPASGSSITPVSRTVGSSATPSVTVESGSNITGITNDGLLFYMQLSTVGVQYRLSTSSKIIIPKGKAIGIYVETSTASLTGVVSFYEDI